MGQNIEGERAAFQGPFLRTPYFHALLRAAHESRAFGEAENSDKRLNQLTTALSIIDRQEIANLQVFEQNGVRIPYTEIAITPAMIHAIVQGDVLPTLQPKLYETIAQEAKNKDGEQERYFLFPAFAPVNENPLSLGDEAADRVLRLLGKAARDVKNGKDIRTIKVILVGSPIGQGGQVTEAYLHQVQEEHFWPWAGVNVGLVEKETAELDPAKTKLFYQGVSIGAQVALRTSQLFQRLHPEFQRVQRLLDNPAVRDDFAPRERQLENAVQVGAGLGIEFAVNMPFVIQRQLMKHAKPFHDYLTAHFAPQDSPEQVALKNRVLLAEVRALLDDGLDTKNTRSFIRRGVTDPLSFNVLTYVSGVWKSNKWKIWGNRKRKIPAFQEGQSLAIPFKGSHFYDPYTRFAAWERQLAYCERLAA